METDRPAVARHTTLGPEVQRLLPAAAVRGSARGPAPAPGDPALTPREADVLGLMAKGFANAAIARRLIVGEPTVKTHVNHLFAKLAVSTGTAAGTERTGCTASRCPPRAAGSRRGWIAGAVRGA
ncbi:response regulator transcription factor [Streptomyces sp. NPDC004270]